AAGYGDVRVRPRHGDRFADGDGVAARVRAVPGVRAAVPVLMLPGAVGRGGQFLSLPVAGVDAGGGARPYRLAAGADLQPGDDEGLLLGASAAERLGVRLGDRVQVQVILAAARRLVLDDGGLGRYELIVRGIVGGNFGAFDPVFVSRRFLGGELGTPAAASVVFAYTDDHFAAGALARRVGDALADTSARDWMEDAPFLRASIHASGVIGALSRSMVFLAVAVPVMALLYIGMLARRRQLALLSALGLSRGEVFTAFLFQTVLIGAGGALVGLAIGAGTVAYFVANPVFSWHAFVVRPALSVPVVVRSTLLAFAAAVGGGIFPAWRACRTDPAAVLREAD
ncbi:MAG: FtsX-like permease family protein, partial [Pseudomonadota bacterium]